MAPGKSCQTINSLNVFEAPPDGLCAKFFARSFAQKYTQTYLLSANLFSLCSISFYGHVGTEYGWSVNIK